MGFKIGDIEIKGKVILAPMAGVTTMSYRKFFSGFDVDLMYTEMVSDMGLIYGNEETKRYVYFEKCHIPVGVQLFGNNPANLAKAVEICMNLNKNIAFFDVNMGCPVNKVTKAGAGSSLMKNPKLCGEIIKEMKKKTSLPITAKIRLGWDEHSKNYLDVIKELEEAGVAAIAIHARTKKELYTGLPHFEELKDLRKKMKVPLLVSGNIFTFDDAIKAIQITGADGVMIARGGMGNPFLANQINHYFKMGERLENSSLEENLKYLENLAMDFVDEFGEEKGMRIYRGIAPKFIIGIKNAKTYKARLAASLNTLEDLKNVISDIKEEILQD